MLCFNRFFCSHGFSQPYPQVGPFSPSLECSILLTVVPTTTQPSSHSPRFVYKSSLVFPPQLFPISSLGIKVVLLSTDHKSYCTLSEISKRLTSNQSGSTPSSLYQNVFKATPFFSKSLCSFSCLTLLSQLSPRGSPSSTIPSQDLFSIRVVPQVVSQQWPEDL